MKHPVEELLEINIYNSTLDKCKTINTIMANLNNNWKTDLDVSTITKNDLLQMLGESPVFKDPIMVESLLDLLIQTFQDSKTLSILLKIYHKCIDRAIILAGFYGKKARKAIPWIRIELGGQRAVGDAKVALLRIGISPKVLYAGLRLAIKQKDGEEFWEIIYFAMPICPGFETSPEMEKIIDKASRSKDTGLKLAVLSFLAKWSLQTQRKYQTVLQRLKNDKNKKISADAAKILDIISNNFMEVT